jgi:MFS family permease
MTDARYKSYLLGVLMLILAFNFVDRLALGLVVQDIKLDLNLTDTQLGLLSGIAFALFYAIMGIPIARWADRGDRVRIIWITTLLWSAAAALCGLANTFVQLLLIRVLVGIGEAGCTPPAHSLIGDYFSRAERPRAVAIYLLGGSLSNVFGYAAAGWLNEEFGWRAMFVIIALPGLVLAAIAAFTLREPRRMRGAKSDLAGAGPAAPTPDLKLVTITLWRNKSFRHLLLSLSLVYLFGYGILQWQPAFFIRSYGLSTTELGLWLAAIYGIGGLLGTFAGGELASRFAGNRESVQLKAIMAANIGFGFVSAGMYLSTNLYLAFALMAVSAVGGAAVSGPLFATLQTLVPQHMRATAIAFVALFSNLIGMGLGPLLGGAVSDALAPFFGQESLRYALLALCPGYAWAAWHRWRASRTVEADVNRSLLIDQGEARA